MNRVVSVVAEGSLTATVSKGWKKEVKLAAEAAKGNAGKSEFREKQLHLEKAAREKQQQEIEDLKKLVMGNAAAAPPSPSQSQAQVFFASVFFFFSTPLHTTDFFALLSSFLS